MDVVILGFYRGWQPAGYAPTGGPLRCGRWSRRSGRKSEDSRRSVHDAGEVYDTRRMSRASDLRDKLNASKWWLLNAEGRKVQGSQTRVGRQLTTWHERCDGRRWPRWLAEAADYERDDAFFPELEQHSPACRRIFQHISRSVLRAGRCRVRHTRARHRIAALA